MSDGVLEGILERNPPEYLYLRYLVTDYVRSTIRMVTKLKLSSFCIELFLILSLQMVISTFIFSIW